MMLIALLVLVVSLTATVLAAATLDRKMRLLREEARDVRTTALLDAALAQALSRLWTNPDASSLPPEPFGGGTIESEFRKIDGLTVEVTVHATYAGARRAARAVVKIDRGSSPDPPEVRLWQPIAPPTSR